MEPLEAGFGAAYISADSHVTEPVNLYRQRVDAQYRERVPWALQACFVPEDP